MFLLFKSQMDKITSYFPLVHGVAHVDDCSVLKRIVCVIRNGLQWKDAPEAYGPHKTWTCNGFVPSRPWSVPVPVARPRPTAPASTSRAGCLPNSQPCHQSSDRPPIGSGNPSGACPESAQRTHGTQANNAMSSSYQPSASPQLSCSGYES
ncbi:hypothetical protein CFR77_11915 [Komagataeibacter sucrofermentans]|uniref:Transposase n=1 Tax=Komagataeibacter sucrofermentans TaxID=1053551 RepID=A0A318QLT9_9PROT|nr:hypothetical protein CFR77_11915 [Komagataeibacter sucrofermentans]